VAASRPPEKSDLAHSLQRPALALAFVYSAPQKRLSGQQQNFISTVTRQTLAHSNINIKLFKNNNLTSGTKPAEGLVLPCIPEVRTWWSKPYRRSQNAIRYTWNQGRALCSIAG
jgi:hypothetical protein